MSELPTSNLVDDQLPDHGQGGPASVPDFVAMLPISRTPTIHELKTWSDVFPGLLDGSKRFESRKYDRDFRVDDLLYLREWDRGGEGSYTGRSIVLRVTYVLFGGRFGIEDGYVVMGLDGVRHADETTAKPARDAEHCDFPDCEKHNTLVVERLRGALQRIIARYDGYTSAKEMMQWAHEALAACPPVEPSQNVPLTELQECLASEGAKDYRIEALEAALDWAGKCSNCENATKRTRMDGYTCRKCGVWYAGPNGFHECSAP